MRLHVVKFGDSIYNVFEKALNSKFKNPHSHSGYSKV